MLDLRSTIGKVRWGEGGGRQGVMKGDSLLGRVCCTWELGACELGASLFHLVQFELCQS